MCCSRKVAKTDLYNERKREGRREEGEIEKAACSAGAGAYKRVAVGGAYGVVVSEHVRAVSGVYCNRLSETLSVMLPYLLC